MLPYTSFQFALLHVVYMLFSNYLYITYLNIPQENISLLLKMYFLHLVSPTALS